MGGKKQNFSSVEENDERYWYWGRSQHYFLNTFTWDALDGSAKQTGKSFGTQKKNVWIPCFCWSNRKIASVEQTSRKSFSVDVRHGRTCSNVWNGIANWQSCLCLDDHQIKIEELENKGELSEMCSHIVLKVFVFGTNWSTWHSVVSQQIVTICHKWTQARDRQLARLISFFYFTSVHRQHCHAGNAAQPCRLRLGISVDRHLTRHFSHAVRTIHLMHITQHWLQCLHARVTPCWCHPWWVVERLFFVSSFWLSLRVSLFHIALLFPFLLVLCAELFLPCGQRQGNHSLRLRQSTSIVLWQNSLLHRLWAQAPWRLPLLGDYWNDLPEGIWRQRYGALVLVWRGTRRWDHRESALFTAVHSGERRVSGPKTILSLLWRKFVASSVIFRTLKNGETRARTLVVQTRTKSRNGRRNKQDSLWKTKNPVVPSCPSGALCLAWPHVSGLLGAQAWCSLRRPRCVLHGHWGHAHTYLNGQSTSVALQRNFLSQTDRCSTDWSAFTSCRTS